MVICLERGADLHMSQLMPLPLTVSCFSKIQIGFTFLVPLTQVVPDKGPLNRCVSVCACVICDSVTKITVSVNLSIICMCCTLRKCYLCLIVNNVGPAMKINHGQNLYVHSPEMTEVQG